MAKSSSGGSGRNPFQEVADQFKSTIQDATRSLSANIARAVPTITLAANEFNKLVGSIRASVGTFVEAYSPHAMLRFNQTVKDTQAALGQILLPQLERFRLLIKSFGDVLLTISPAAKTMVVGLASAAVGMTVMAAAVAGFNVVMATATGGLSVILGAVGGAVAGLAAAVVPMSGTLEQFKKVLGGFSEFGVRILDAMGDGFDTVFAAMQPAVKGFFTLLKDLEGPFVANIKQIASNAGQFIAGIMPAIQQLMPSLFDIGKSLLALNLGSLKAIALAIPPIVAAFSALAKVMTILLQPLRIMLELLAGTSAAIGVDPVKMKDSAGMGYMSATTQSTEAMLRGISERAMSAGSADTSPVGKTAANTGGILKVLHGISNDTFAIRMAMKYGPQVATGGAIPYLTGSSRPAKEDLAEMEHRQLMARSFTGH